MKQSGNPTVAASVPKGAAGAANWKSWGAEVPSQSTIPPGAVVVLSPGEGSGGHGHVGFFRSFSADKKNVILLGGNQGSKVGESPFLASRISRVFDGWTCLVPRASLMLTGSTCRPTRSKPPIANLPT